MSCSNIANNLLSKHYSKVSRDPNRLGAGKSVIRALKALKKSDPITYDRLSVNAAQERTEGIGYDDGSYTYELFTKAFDSRDQRRETRIRNLTTAYAAVQRSNSYKIFQREWRESSSAGSVIFSNPGCSHHESVRSAEVIRKQHLSMVKRTTVVRLVN